MLMNYFNAVWLLLFSGGGGGGGATSEILWQGVRAEP